MNIFKKLFGSAPLPAGRVELDEASYNNLKVNMLLRTKASEHTSFMVISAERNAGRTTVAVETAKMFAKLGRRVALVETDLRNPEFEKIFALGRKPGLCDVIVELSSLENIVCNNAGPYGFDVYTAGTPMINSTEIVAMAKFADIMNRIKTSYDICIFDTPAVLDAPDALLLAQYVESTIFVLNTLTSNSRKVAEVRERLLRVNPNMAGFILNYATATAVF